MPIKKSLIILFVFLLFSNANAQKYELGKVTIAELQEKEHPKDPSAPAAMLFRKCRVYFEDLTTITRVTTKIKFIKKRGISGQTRRFYITQAGKVSLFLM